MDLECPYCDTPLKINHDDGFGYEEDVKHEMECDFCGKSFVFYTYISYHYSPEKADCLNGEDHNFTLTCTAPRVYSKMRCTMCDTERECTDEERILYKLGSYEDYIKSLK